MSFPNKADRAKCWNSRDEYWQCLDNNKQLEPVKDGPCQHLRNLFESSCSGQWIKHFDRKRGYLQFKEKIEKEGISAPTHNATKIKEKRRVYTEIAT